MVAISIIYLKILTQNGLLKYKDLRSTTKTTTLNEKTLRDKSLSKNPLFKIPTKFNQLVEDPKMEIQCKPKI